MKIESVELVDGKLEVVRRIKSNVMLTSNRPKPDRVWKEIFGVVNGEIRLVDSIEGKPLEV